MGSSANVPPLAAAIAFFAVTSLFAHEATVPLTPEKNVDLRSFGAVPDGEKIDDASIGLGMRKLCSAKRVFGKSDIGKHVVVWGAGELQGALVANVSSLSAEQDGCAIISKAAVAPLRDGSALLGTDNAPAINQAYAEAARSGGQVMIPDASKSFGFADQIRVSVSGGRTVSTAGRGTLLFLAPNLLNPTNPRYITAAFSFSGTPSDQWLWRGPAIDMGGRIGNSANKYNVPGIQGGEPLTGEPGKFWSTLFNYGAIKVSGFGAAKIDGMRITNTLGSAGLFLGANAALRMDVTLNNLNIEHGSGILSGGFYGFNLKEYAVYHATVRGIAWNDRDTSHAGVPSTAAFGCQRCSRQIMAHIHVQGAQLVSFGGQGTNIFTLGSLTQRNGIATAITGAIFRGSLSGADLTINGSPSVGAVAIGQFLTGPSVSDQTFITGGSGQHWVVNRPQSVAATEMISGPHFLEVGSTVQISGLAPGIGANAYYLDRLFKVSAIANAVTFKFPVSVYAHQNPAIDPRTTRIVGVEQGELIRYTDTTSDHPPADMASLTWFRAELAGVKTDYSGDCGITFAQTSHIVVADTVVSSVSVCGIDAQDALTARYSNITVRDVAQGFRLMPTSSTGIGINPAHAGAMAVFPTLIVLDGITINQSKVSAANLGPAVTWFLTNNPHGTPPAYRNVPGRADNIRVNAIPSAPLWNIGIPEAVLGVTSYSTVSGIDTLCLGNFGHTNRFVAYEPNESFVWISNIGGTPVAGENFACTGGGGFTANSAGTFPTGTVLGKKIVDSQRERILQHAR